MIKTIEKVNSFVASKIVPDDNAKETTHSNEQSCQKILGSVYPSRKIQEQLKPYLNTGSSGQNEQSCQKKMKSVFPSKEIQQSLYAYIYPYAPAPHVKILKNKNSIEKNL